MPMSTFANQFERRFIPLLGVLLSCTCGPMVSSSRAAALGEFESATDVGVIEVKGSSEFLPDKGQYRITGSGANIWAKEDAFQFLSKKASGDLALSMDVGWVGEGKVKIVAAKYDLDDGKVTLMESK